jgi:photosystem II stability/assembly factor-like uncharacterized protein
MAASVGPGVLASRLAGGALAAGVAAALCGYSCSPAPHTGASTALGPTLASAGGGAAGARFDQPDAAEAYERAKRAGPTPGFDAGAAYARARARLAGMVRYSSRLGSFLPDEPAGGTAGPPGATASSVLAGWESLGPGNIGGRTRVLLVDPTDTDLMYAAGVSGGVWKTSDGGASWRSLFDSQPNLAVNSLAMDPDDPAVLYAGTGEGYFREEVRGTGLPLRGNGVFKTADRGETWTRLDATAGDDFQWVNDLVISVNDSRRLYAATRTGVWRSADAGESWQRVLDPSVNGGCLDLAMRTDRTTDYLFASCGTLAQATVYRAEAAERDDPWTSVFSEPGMGRTSIAVAPSNQNVVYALAASNVPGPGGVFAQGLLGVFRSSASGDPGTWAARVRNTSSDVVATVLLTNPIAAVAAQCGQGLANSYITMGWYVNVIAVDPTNADRVWAAGVDLFRSEDGGRSWGPVSYWWASTNQPSYVHADVHGITFPPGWNGTTNQTMLVVGDGGVFRTDAALLAIGHGMQSLCSPTSSAVRFHSLNHSLGVTQFYHGLPFPGGHNFIGGTQDNGTITGNDTTGPNAWRFLLGGDGGYVAIDPDHPDVIYAESQGFDLYRSNNRGGTWQPARFGVTDSAGSFLFITPFVLDPTDSRRLWSGGRRLWRSDDQASTWTAASTTLGDGAMVSALVVAPTMPSRVLAGTNTGTIYRNDAAPNPTASATWAAATPRSGFVTSLAVDPADASVAYATYGGFGGQHVWRSADGGAHWQPLDGEGNDAVPDVPVHCLLVDPDRRERLFLGTDLGVLVSTDFGASWAVEDTGFATVVTEALSLTRDEENRPVLFAFTHGRGAWRVLLSPPDAYAPRPPRRRGARMGS